MAFRGILPEVPSFGQQLARGLGAGLGAGASQVGDMASQLMQERFKQQQRASMIDKVRQSQSDQSSGSTAASQGQNQKTNPADKLWKEAEMFGMLGEESLARQSIEKAKLAEKRSMVEEERAYLPTKEFHQHEAKRTNEFLEKVDQIESDLPNTEFSLAMMEDALTDANKWAAARDLLAEKTGFQGFRSASGAELDSAIKTYFLGDLSSIKGGRPNVFIEKQLRDAYQKTGQDPISNQKIMLGMRMKEGINRALIEKTNELREKFIEAGKPLPVGFREMVNKSLRPEIEKIEKNSIKTLKNLSTIESKRNELFRSQLKSGEYLMMSPEGEPFAVPKKEVSSYREQGYIPLGQK